MLTFSRMAKNFQNFSAHLREQREKVVNTVLQAAKTITVDNGYYGSFCATHFGLFVPVISEPLCQIKRFVLCQYNGSDCATLDVKESGKTVRIVPL